MENTALTEMRTQWDALRAGRLLPLRSEVDPRSLESGLEYSFLVERTQPGHVRIRVAGMHLCDLMSMEVRGMPLRAFIHVRSRGVFTSRLERVFEGPEIQIHHLMSDDHGAAPMAGKMQILPLRSDNGAIDRALGCLITSGTVGPHPRRFRLLETEVTCLYTGTQKSLEAAKESELQTAPGFSESQQKFSHKLTASRTIGTRPDGRPDLQLVSKTPK